MPLIIVILSNKTLTLLIHDQYKRGKFNNISCVIALQQPNINNICIFDLIPHVLSLFSSNQEVW